MISDPPKLSPMVQLSVARALADLAADQIEVLMTQLEGPGAAEVRQAFQQLQRASGLLGVAVSVRSNGSHVG
ncbi:MAG TPA: hypothetical protein VHQ86_00290 [Candidatus Saccharimonadia bacterium]|nr:hypothetical protein [Candidatus Saccharimonadia bacterium]